MAYSYKRSITIDHTKCGSADSTNLAVLVSGTYSYLATVANGGKVQNANGYDIAFYSDSALTTQLDHQTETYTAASGLVNYWVKVPTVSASTDTVIYMAYGDSGISTDQSDAANTWDSSYEGVWHLRDGTTLSGTESTSNGRNGTLTGSPTAVAGQIDGGANLSGSSQYITMGNVIDVTTGDLTIECWFNSANSNQTRQFISKRLASGSFAQWGFGQGYVNSSGVGVTGKQLYFLAFGGSLPAAQSYHTTNNVADGNWHYAVMRRASGVVTIWVDGTSMSLTADIANTTAPNTSNSAALNFGYDNSSSYWTGKLDEVRISKATRSDSYILTRYNNDSSPSTFYTIGLENLVPTVSDSVTTSESVTVSIAGGVSTLSVNVSDTVTVTESTNQLITRLYETVSDSVTVTESTTVAIQATQTLSVNVSDSVTVTESVVTNVNTSVNVSDSTTISEAVNLLISTLFIGVSDTTTLTESTNVTISSSGSTLISVSDTVTTSENTLLSFLAALAVSDSTTVTEAVQDSVTSYVNVSDSVTVTESASTSIVASGTPSITVSDTVTVTESTNVLIPTLGVNVSDSTTVSEAVTVAFPSSYTLPQVLNLQLDEDLSMALPSYTSRIAFSAGPPTGSPTGYLMVFDYTNSDLYIYNQNSSSWVKVGLT